MTGSLTLYHFPTFEEMYRMMVHLPNYIPLPFKKASEFVSRGELNNVGGNMIQWYESFVNFYCLGHSWFYMLLFLFIFFSSFLLHVPILNGNLTFIERSFLLSSRY